MTAVLPPAAHCSDCGGVTFPATRRCPLCVSRSQPKAMRLSEQGRLFEWTTVFSPAPGFEAPYVVGYVDLPEGVRLFGQVVGASDGLQAGEIVDIVSPGTLGHVGESLAKLPYVFIRSNGSRPNTGMTAGEVPAAAAGSAVGRAPVDRSGGVWIAGVGMTRFGRFPDTAAEELAQEAIIDALDDAGVAPSIVECVFVGHVFQGRVAGQRIVRDIGLAGRSVINVENACASGASALHLAIEAVGSGRCDVALAVGVEQLSVLGKGVIPPDRLDLEGAHGRTNPATYALMAKRHMAEFGTTPEDLASVVVQARANGRQNERAQMRQLTSVDEVLASPVIAAPLSRLQCCPIGDGAAAAVVVSDRVARQIERRHVRVRASIVCGGVRRPVGDRFVSHPVTRLTAEAAYEDAGVGPGDVDVVEVHDAFSIAMPVHLEDLGFFAPGDAAPRIAGGATAIGGNLPVNPSGGLLAKGHPLGASGLAQVFELAEQLRERGGARQVSGARIALAQCEGGVVYGLDAGVCAIHVLEAA